MGSVRDPHLARAAPSARSSWAWPAFGTLGCAAFYIVWGNSVLWLDLHGGLALLDLVRAGEAATAIAAAIAALAGQPGPLLLFLILGFVFVATTYDSASYAIAAAATRNLRPGAHPHRAHRLFWAGALAFLPVALIVIGSLEALAVGGARDVAAHPRHRGPGGGVAAAFAAGGRRDAMTGAAGPRRLGIGFVGSGFITRFHIRSMVGACAMRTCAAAGARAAGMRRKRPRWPAGSEVGDARAFPSIDAMVADPAVDAVWICGPNHTRIENMEAIVAALRAAPAALRGVGLREAPGPHRRRGAADAGARGRGGGPPRLYREPALRAGRQPRARAGVAAGARP